MQEGTAVQRDLTRPTSRVRRSARNGAVTALVALLVGLTGFGAHMAVAEEPSPVPRPECGPGSSPETGVQGQVPRADRDSGRSAQGYSCNMELVGQHQGKGAGPVSPTYGHCSYTGSFTGNVGRGGVTVLDVSDPANPKPTDELLSPAMATVTWESLKVNEERGLLAATGVPAFPGEGAGTFDIYDISEDCAHPRLLNRVPGTNLTPPMPILGAHEGGFSPDGNTYYATGAYNGALTAIDVSEPTRPRVVFTGTTGLTNHGFSISADGNTMYGVTAVPAGIQILDISDINARKPVPLLREISHLSWPTEGLFTQHTIPFTSGGHPYLIAVDEANNGGVRLIDVQDPTDPTVVKKYPLEIGLPQNLQKRQQDVGGDGLFGYESHYCSIDRPENPSALACGYFHSGIRVFDINDPMAPRETAYYNPPAQTGKTVLDLPNSTHALTVNVPPALSLNSLTMQNIAESVVKPDMTTDWCMSPPEFHGKDQLWVTCNDNGFMALRFTNDSKPTS